MSVVYLIPNVKKDNELTDLDEQLDILDQMPTPQLPQGITNDQDIEFYQCQRCNEWNILKSRKERRRITKVRHIRIDEVTWQSFKRFQALNGVKANYALTLLLMNAQTKNINYMVNDRVLVQKAEPKPKLPVKKIVPKQKPMHIEPPPSTPESFAKAVEQDAAIVRDFMEQRKQEQQQPKDNRSGSITLANDDYQTKKNKRLLF